MNTKPPCTKTPHISLTVVGFAALLVSSHAMAGQAEMAAFHEDKMGMSASTAYVANSVLIKFKPTATNKAVNKALAAAQAILVREFGLVPGLVHARTKMPVDKAVAALSRNPLVEYAEPDFVQRAVATTPNDTYFGLQWGLHNTGQSIRGVYGLPDADIDMPETWDISTGGPGCLVAVIDTGTQWNHPDLDANIWANAGEIAGNGIDDDGNGYVDDVRGWDFFDNDNNPDDGDGHGTHTAGTIAAESNNGTGVAGVAWNCKIMPLRFLGPEGGATSDAVKALDYAVAKGVKVSNNSWGGGSYSTALYNAIANSRAAGHVFVAAAGNDGVNTDNSPHYPSAYNLDNIIAVAATDNNDRLASFSNYGASTVDLGAPGVDIASTYSGSNYVWSSGTSMAAPHVAGVVALVYLKNPGFTYSQVVNQVLSTARPVTSLAGVTVTGGMLNAFNALSGDGGGTPEENAAPTVSISSPTNGASFLKGTSITFSGGASDKEDGDLTGALVWTSNLDAKIGMGASFTTNTLAEGTHTITASVTDAGGITASQSITIAIGSAPAAPDSVSAVNNKNNTATVKWADKSSNEDSFQIERQKKNKNGTWGSTTSFTVGKDVTSYTDKSGTGTFRYQVRSRNKFGDSSWTTWVEVTVTRK